ncbi:MAG: hypothetical protein NVSMB52_06830 [Chloroflexota bacterium]
MPTEEVISPAVSTHSPITKLLSFPGLLLIFLLASPFFSSTDVSKGTPILRDPDIWWHLRNAEVLLSTHRFIASDLYSYTTSGLSWVNPEWMAELPYYLGFRVWGEPGLFYVMLGAFECIILGIFLLCYLRSGDFLASYVAAWIGVFLAVVNFGPRTILFGWICFVAELLILQCFRRDSRLAWLLVPLFALWINLHGSWMIGFIFFLVYATSGAVRGSWGSIDAEGWRSSELHQLLRVGLASAAALFANPYGWRLVVYPLDFAFRQKLNVSIGEEWQSVNFNRPNGKIFFFVLLSLATLNLLRRGRWLLQELLFVLLAVYSAATHVRFLFLAGIVLSPVIAAEIGVASGAERKQNRPALNAGLIGMILILVFFRFPRSAVLHAGVESAFPSKAFERLSTFGPQSRVLNAYGYGGYMIWKTREVPTFIDSRTDIFEHHGILADYSKLINLDDTLGVLDKYRIRYVFFPKSDPVVYLLEHTPGWKVNFDDGAAVILERTP